MHFGITPEDLYRPHASTPWNPLIAQVFYRRGIIESWGRGTLKMVQLTASAGLPKPEIESDTASVTVRFRPSVYIAPERVGHDLSDRQQLILTLLGRTQNMPLREIRAALGSDVPDWAIKEDLALLKGLQLIDHAGYGRGASWFLKR